MSGQNQEVLASLRNRNNPKRGARFPGGTPRMTWHGYGQGGLPTGQAGTPPAMMTWPGAPTSPLRYGIPDMGARPELTTVGQILGNMPAPYLGGYPDAPDAMPWRRY